MWMRYAIGLFFLIASAATAEAKVFQCVGKNGGTVLTDRPQAFEGCVPMNTSAPSTPAGFIAPADPPPEPVFHPDHPPPMLLPNGTPPPLHPGQGDPAATAAPQQPPAAEASNSAACAPTVNPLNPFAAANCPPKSSDASASNKKP
jgi:hypothetical protein